MRRGQRLYGLAALGALVVAVGLCFVLLELVRDGLGQWHWDLIWRHPRELAVNGGIGPEILNTVSMVTLAEIVSLPLSLAAAIWLVEYAPRNRWIRGLEYGVAAFQSIPGIVLGLVVFQVLIHTLHWPLSVGSGTIALAVLNLPALLMAFRHQLRRVPDYLRETSLALGASRVQTLWRVVLPYSLGPMVDQVGLSWARLAGESALLIFTAGINVGPRWGWFQPGETLAVHLWYVRTEGLMPDRAAIAAQTGIVLIGLTAAAVIITKVWARRIGQRQRGGGPDSPSSYSSRAGR